MSYTLAMASFSTPATRIALHFDQFCEQLAEQARTAAGRSALASLKPLPAQALAEERLEEVSEWQAVLTREGRLVTAGLADPLPASARLTIEGSVLDPLEVRALAASLTACVKVAANFMALDAVAFPRLKAWSKQVPRWEPWVASLAVWVDAEGLLADEASPELARIRRERVRQAERLQGHLERLLQSLDKGGYLQEKFVTERSGRMVIPVRSAIPRERRGIVHASSSSGATLFVEPIEVVDGNNERIALRERETAEIHRILVDWTERLRSRKEEVAEALSTLGHFDLLETIAGWAVTVDAVVPSFDNEADLVLTEMRHPLLLSRGVDVVPLNLIWPTDRPVLVISGPNAGGKTVALLSLGLAAFCARSGIPLPAREVTLPWFRQVFADIGDPQSLAADLSTFSGHMDGVARMFQTLDPPALILFDEPGSGTEPDEGASLARAVLESLATRPGARVAVSTHHGALKAWAASRDDVLDAAMEFDDVQLEPTYRLLLGASGISAGFAIARRMGVPGEIVTAAESNLDDTRRETRRILDRLREQERGMDRKQQKIQAERDAWQEERQALRADLERGREAAVKALEKELESERKLFRRRGRSALESIENRRGKEQAARKLAQAETAMRSTIDRLKRGDRPSDTEGLPFETPPEKGARVFVPSLGKEATVEAIDGDRARVRAGVFSLPVDWKDLRRPGAQAEKVSRVPSRPLPVVEPELEFSLIGERVEPALERLDRVIDRAVLAGQETIRIVHGHGTGRLKRAVRAFLQAHPHVAAHRAGGTGEGGDGATVVTLR